MNYKKTVLSGHVRESGMRTTNGQLLGIEHVDDRSREKKALYNADHSN